MTPPLRIDIVTLFPALFDGFLGESLIGKAIERGLLDIRRWDLRDWGEGVHRQVDDRPYGGGPGMVLMAPPLVTAVESIRTRDPDPGRLIVLTPQGMRLDQSLVRELAAERRLVLLAGRYEGFDERALDILGAEPVSIGDYVLSGGEVPAMVVIEAVSRLVPGVLGDAESTSEESFAPGHGLEYPHYTRPRDFRGHRVPEILLSGDHGAIAAWRRERSRERTRLRRQDLIATGPEVQRGTDSASAFDGDAQPSSGTDPDRG